MNLDSFFQKYKFPLAFGLIGLIFLGVGVLVFKIFFVSEPKVEISSISAELPQQNKVAADIGGAVQKPGLYELLVGSRVNDLLIAAGGLSGQADRDWVAKNINLAQKLADGAKIYIPKKGEIMGEKTQAAGGSTKVSGLININTASQNLLESLWGVGPVTAQKIIENRPFQKNEELFNKKIVKSNVWEAIKEKITVY